MSLRSIAKQNGISHSTLSRMIAGKYKGANSRILGKIIGNIDGVIIPRDKFLEILKMLDMARFPQKFQSAHRTASWLWDVINTANNKQKEEVNNGE
jgi:hypothetical protein